MAKAKVLVTRVQGAGRNTFTLGEVVSHTDFPEGNFESLVKSGHIEQMAEETKAEKKVREDAEKAEAKKKSQDEADKAEFDALEAKETKAKK